MAFRLRTGELRDRVKPDHFPQFWRGRGKAVIAQFPWPPGTVPSGLGLTARMT